MLRSKKLWTLLLGSALALAPMAAFAQEDVSLTVVGVTVPPEEIGTPLDLAYQDLVNSFQEANPNVTLNVVEQPPEFETQIMVDLAAGTAPDVWRAGQAMLPELNEGNYILDVRQCTEYAPELTFDRFIPSILAIHQPEGEDGPIYGVPNGFTPMVFYYNPESFERAGVDLPTSEWTTEEFLDVVQRLTLDANGNNAQSPDFDPENVEQYGVRVRKFFVLENLPWVWTFGGDIISEDGTTVDGYLNSAETIEAITFLRDLVLEYNVAPEPNALDSMTQERAFPAVFLDGNVAMYPRGQWELVGLQNQPNYEPGRVAVVGYPVGARDATIAFEDGWVINAAVANDEAKLAAACSFIDFATSPVFQDSKAVTGLEISANAAVAAQAAEVSQWPEVQQTFVDEAEDALPDPNTRFSFWAVVDPRLDLMMENILAGADVQAEIDLAVEEINRELERQ